MNELSSRPVSSLRLLFIYTATLAGLGVLLNLLIVALDEFFDITFGNSAMGFILVYVAANYVGQFSVSREGCRPPSGRAWKVAGLCTVATVALQSFMIWASYELQHLAGEPQFIPTLRGEDISFLAAIFAGIAVLALLVIRLGIEMGARQAMKQRAKVAAQSDA